MTQTVAQDKLLIWKLMTGKKRKINVSKKKKHLNNLECSHYFAHKKVVIQSQTKSFE